MNKRLLKCLLCLRSLKDLAVTFVPETRRPGPFEDVSSFEVEFLEQTVADDLETVEVENPA